MKHFFGLFLLSVSLVVLFGCSQSTSIEKSNGNYFYSVVAESGGVPVPGATVIAIISETEDVIVQAD